MINTGFLWILLAGTLYGFIHSVFASMWLKNKAANWLGTAGKKYYRLFFVGVAFITTGVYFLTVFLFPDEILYRIPFPWVILTSALELLAIVGVLKCLLATGVLAFMGIDVVLRKSLSVPNEKLITGGCYRWMRHPIYSFSFVIIWLCPVMSWNLLAFFLGVTAYTLIGSFFEEQKLLLIFGEEYQKYQQSTPAFLPKLKK